MPIRGGSQDPREAAETIGAQALVFLAEDEGRLGRFLGETGLSPDDLRAAAGTSEGLLAVLDHLLQDESLLMVFAAEAGIDPAGIGPAREVLASDPAGRRTDTRVAGSREPAKRASRRWPGPGA